MGTNNIAALLAACKVLADVINDATSGSTVDAYVNVLPDLMTLLPQIGQLGSEAKSLQTADYETLVGQLAGYLTLSGKAETILQASIKLLSDLQPVVLDVQALIAATK